MVNRTNGGEEYVVPRQDIYLADTGEVANAIHVTGNITGAEGSIWVWPEETMEHRKSEQQFAIKDPGDNLSSGTYKVFRNALPDNLSENVKDAWLTGAKKPKDKTNSLIIWSDRLDRRHVVLIKLDEEGQPLIGPKFTIHEGIASYPYKLNIDGEDVKLENLTELNNGIFFMGVIPYGTYTVHETDIPEGYAGHGTESGLWYTLIINEDGASLSEARTEQAYPGSETNAG